MRSASSSNLALKESLTPLNIRPVKRLPTPKLPTPPSTGLHKVPSLWELAPDLPERRGRRVPENGLNVGDSSQMRTFLAAHVGV